MSGKKAIGSFEGQLEGEEALMLFRKHPVVMRKGLIVGALGLLIGPLFVAIASYVKPELVPSPTEYLLLLLAGFVLAGVLFFPTLMSWYFSVYVVTSHRFLQIVQKGFFERGVSDTPLRQIQSINHFVRGMQETLLGYGTIEIQTYIGDIVIRDVHHPEKTCAQLSDILLDLGIHPLNYPAESERVD